MNIETKEYTLHTKHSFGISRGTTSEFPTLLCKIGDGIGEGSPVRYKKQELAPMHGLIEKMAEGLEPAMLDDMDALNARARKIADAHPGGHSAALTAFDIACWDWRARLHGEPLYRELGAHSPVDHLSTYTIGLALPEVMEARAKEAAALPLLKIKLGRSYEHDIDVMRRIRAAAPDSTLRIDANAGWDLETARRIIPELYDLEVDLVEQPLAIGNIEETAILHKESRIPIILDEDCQTMDDLPGLVGKVSGINIKLMKCGGITEALKMITYARHHDWDVFVGCMIETRAGLGAAAHLAAKVDMLDLDAWVLTDNDPFPPGSAPEPTANLPLGDLHAPGLGLEWPFAQPAFAGAGI